MAQYYKKNGISRNYHHMRIAYLLVVITTIVLGLASRKFSNHIPSFLADNSGDVLWAIMVYFAFRLLVVRFKKVTALYLSFLFCFGIEFSQLYQVDWLIHIRSTSLGALVFGKGFLIIDLFRYTVGIIIGRTLDWLGEYFIIRKRRSRF